MSNLKKLATLMILLVLGCATAYGQSKDSDITLKAKEYDNYLRWYIIGHSCVQDAANYQAEILNIKKANQGLKKVIKNDSIDLVLAAVTDSAANKKIREYRDTLAKRNNQYYKAKKRQKFFAKTTAILVSVSMLEGLFIWAIIKT